MRIPRKLEKTKALEEKRQTPNPFNSAFYVFAKNNLTYTVFACVEPGSIYCSFFFFFLITFDVLKPASSE
jgi:hypothetical protein